MNIFLPSEFLTPWQNCSTLACPRCFREQIVGKLSFSGIPVCQKQVPAWLIHFYLRYSYFSLRHVYFVLRIKNSSLILKVENIPPACSILDITYISYSGITILPCQAEALKCCDSYCQPRQK